MSGVDHAARFETIGALYYAATGYLRPGKSEPLATNRDSSSAENVARFDEWMATRCWGTLVDRVTFLEQRKEELLERLEKLEEQLEACDLNGPGGAGTELT